MRLLKIFALLIVCIIAVEQAEAATRRALCKPKGICLTRDEIPSHQRKSVLPDSFPVSRSLTATSGDALVSFPPDQGDPTPFTFKIPANREIKTICYRRGGQLECFQAVQNLECPETIKIQDSPGGALYECDIQCSPPDSDGNCDCDIEYNTCHAL